MLTLPMRPLPDEPSIYPYTATRCVPASGVLVFAPHPDDEVLGCGGLVAALLEAGVPVRVVVVSDGGLGGDVLQRERESRAAARELAGPHPPPSIEFWGQPDRSVAASAGLVERMCQAMIDSGADWVLAPSPYEIHPDHRAVAVAAAMAFASAHGEDSTAKLAFFEVGHPLFANLLVDITPVLGRKAAALQCFPSQLAVQDYGQQLLALNRFRSYTLGRHVTHAEAYQVHDAKAVSAGLARLISDIGAGVVTRLGF